MILCVEFHYSRSRARAPGPGILPKRDSLVFNLLWSWGKSVDDVKLMPREVLVVFFFFFDMATLNAALGICIPYYRYLGFYVAGRVARMQSAIIVQCTERVMSLHLRRRVRYRAKWIWGRWLLQAQGYERFDKDEAVGEISMTRIHTVSLFLSALSLSLSVSLSLPSGVRNSVSVLEGRYHTAYLTFHLLMLMLMTTTTTMIDDDDGDNNDDRLSDMGVWVYARGNVITHRYPKTDDTDKEGKCKCIRLCRSVPTQFA